MTTPMKLMELFQREDSQVVLDKDGNQRIKTQRSVTIPFEAYERLCALSIKNQRDLKKSLTSIYEVITENEYKERGIEYAAQNEL